MIFPLIAGNSQNVNDTEHLENIDSCHLRKENKLFTLKKNPTFRTKLKITHLNFEVKQDAKTKVGKLLLTHLSPLLPHFFPPI